MDSEEKLAIKLFWWLIPLSFIIGVIFGWLMFNPSIYVVTEAPKAEISMELFPSIA